MSSPSSAFENPPSTPPVTPAASAQHDCPDRPGSLHGKQRQHRGAQPAHLDRQRAPSPSRAESPSARQWATNPSSTLKRNTTAPVENAARPGLSYTSYNTPQLSERDSIFATHYLPSDGEGANSPQFPPAGAAARYDAAKLNSQPGNASSSSFTPKVLSYNNRVDDAHMEVDSHRIRPLHSAPLLPSHPPLSFSPEDTDVTLGENLDIPAAGSRREKPPNHRKSSLHGVNANRGLYPSPSIEHSMVTSPDNRPTVSPGSSSVQKGQPSGESAQESKLERSSSRSRRGRVENSIEANINAAEPPAYVRSRKSSHYLGLFKENTASSPDRKRRDDRTARYEDAVDSFDHEQEGLFVDQRHYHDSHQEANTLEKPELQSAQGVSPLSLANTPLIKPATGDDSANTYLVDDAPHKPERKALPRSLLEEIRNFHLTPGGARGASLSRSIPAQFPDRGTGFLHGLSPLSDTAAPEHREGSAQPDEDEDEQISSAVYFPHERVTVSEEVDQVHSFEEGPRDLQPDEQSPLESSLNLKPERSTAPDEPEANHVDISLRSKSDSRILHGDLQDRKTPIEELNDKSIDLMFQRQTEYSTEDSEAVSADDSGMSTRDEESSVTDEAEVTPTATPTQRAHLPRARRKHGAVTPVGAVELKPYRHQVGGHTTVFRFSRRAVCKQLNNRENEFYERIERRHPEMLMFLPRYVLYSCRT